MDAISLGKVTLRGGGRLVLTAQGGRAFPDGIAFLLVPREGGGFGEGGSPTAECLAGGKLPPGSIPLTGKVSKRKAALQLPDALRKGDYQVVSVEEGKVRDKREGCLPSGSFRLLLLTGQARRGLLLFSPRAGLPGNLLLFPMGGDGNSLLLRCRERNRFDGLPVFLRERFAFALAKLLKPTGLYQDSWVVFEKSCAQAQDNGAAFFRYCQENLPLRERRRVYYILDSRCPAWEGMRGTFGRQVVPFMGLKHMLLMMLSRLYVASESKYHGYAWRCPPNPVFRDIRRGNHRIFFLQHGVTAMKRVEGVFGREGYNPMDYVAVTADWEQRIFVEHFGYEPARVPVTGFARWDYWEDRRGIGSVSGTGTGSVATAPLILLAPTWRAYLDGKDEAFFQQSEYYQAYKDLLTDPALRELLERLDLTMAFYLHPRLANQMLSFSGTSVEDGASVDAGGAERRGKSRIEVIPYDGKNLPDLLMRASALITDYSSMAFDACYLNRPVLFYRFDAERYAKETGSYIGDDALPGEIYTTREALYEGIARVAAEGFVPKPGCGRELFAHPEGGNCERILAFLKKL